MNASLNRATVLAIAILAPVMMTAACGQKPEVASEAVPEEGEVRVYEVFGMDCPGCHGGLQNLLESVPGVTSARASWEKKQVTVVVAEDANVADAEVAAAIRNANFTPGERLE